jgi:preprotein translocase subunit Sec63
MKVTKEQAYEILELTAHSDEAEVKKAYRRLALALHPDKNGGCPESAEKFKLVSAAYARLTSGNESDDELDDEDLSAFSMEIFEELFGEDSELPMFLL